MRKCSECNKVMYSGYCINGGEEYYCSDECLRKHYTEEEYLEMYDDGDGDSYWTEWEDETPTWEDIKKELDMLGWDDHDENDEEFTFIYCNDEIIISKKTNEAKSLNTGEIIGIDDLLQNLKENE